MIQKLVQHQNAKGVTAGRLGVYGKIASGKSTLINAIFNNRTLCVTGACETTLRSSCVGNIHNRSIWDNPGDSTKFDILQYQNLMDFIDCGTVCLVVNYSLNDPYYNKLLRMCHKLSKKVLVVISKSDLLENQDRIQLKEAMKGEMMSAVGQVSPMFFVSARNFLDGNQNYLDWSVFIQNL